MKHYTSSFSLFNVIFTFGIELPWPENLANTCTRHTETLDLLGLFSSVYHDLLQWRLNQWPQSAESKLYHWAISSHCIQVMPNQLVMVIAWPIYLNVSCKLLLYSLQRTQSPPGPCITYIYLCGLFDTKAILEEEQ